MGFHDMHNRFIERTYAWRARYYGPLVRALVRMGITANGITAARLFFIIPLAYFLFIRTNWWAAFSTYLLFWIIDTVDGSVARATSTATDRGKFLDVFVDNFVYSFLIISFIFLDAAPASLLAYHVLIQLTAYILGIIYANEGTPSDWIIKPQAEQQYNKIAAHTALFLYIVSVDIMTIGFIIINSWLTVQSLYLFKRLMARTHH